MNEFEKIKILLDKGYTCDIENWIIYGVKKKPIIRSNKRGYIIINNSNPRFNLAGHRFIWYMKYNNLPRFLDHINGNTSDNKINNLREITHQQNCWNKVKTKGYYQNKDGKFYSFITINRKNKFLGSFITEEEARNAYLNAKSIYHQI